MVSVCVCGVGGVGRGCMRVHACVGVCVCVSVCMCECMSV